MNTQPDILAGLPGGKLTPEVEKEMMETLHDPHVKETTREYAKETLILHNLREAVVYSRAVSKGRLEDGELLSLCYKALIRAIGSFKLGFETRFFGYSKPFIRGEICNEWKRKDAVKNSEGMEELSNAEDSPEVDTGFEQAANHSGIDGSNKSPGQIVPTVEPDFDGIDLKEKWELIKPILGSLSGQEQTVIQLRYEAGYNFNDIGRMMGVTRSAIQQTHSRALKKVRNALMRQKRFFQE